MNPITETRYTLVRYVVLWTLIAALYALVFGTLAGLPPWAAVVDGMVFGAVSGVEGLILWNVLKYGTAGSPTVNIFRIGRVLLILAAGVLFIVVAVGAETAALWLLSETAEGPAAESGLWAFPRTIPARSLTVAAVYACFVLWYSSADRSEAGTPAADLSYAKPSESDPPKYGETVAPEPIERITVRGTGGRIEVIDIRNVVYIQAEGDYVAIVTPTGRWLKEGTMKWFEEALPRERFVRVHRSFIVSVSHISRIETSGRDHTLIMRGGSGNGRGGSPVRISDAGYRLLKRTLGL